MTHRAEKENWREYLLRRIAEFLRRTEALLPDAEKKSDGSSAWTVRRTRDPDIPPLVSDSPHNWPIYTPDLSSTSYESSALPAHMGNGHVSRTSIRCPSRSHDTLSYMDVMACSVYRVDPECHLEADGPRATVT